MLWPSKHRHEFFFLLFLLFGVSATVIWVRTATVRETYAFVQNEKELNRAKQVAQTTRLKWLKMTSPKQLETIAGNLGLAPPKLSQVMKLAVKAKKVF